MNDLELTSRNLVQLLGSAQQLKYILINCHAQRDG